jgi:flagellar biosynthesis protein FlhF
MPLCFLSVLQAHNQILTITLYNHKKACFEAMLHTCTQKFSTGAQKTKRQSYLYIPMRLKTFTAPTMPQAMKLVRATLGEHAVIMSTQQNKTGVTVTAGIDEDVLDRAKAATPLSFPIAPAPLSDTDVLDTLTDALEQHGATRRLIQKLLRLVADENTSSAAVILEQVLGTHYRFADLAAAGHPKPCVLVGPPGAGKTVAVAKLATQAVLHGHKVVVITADTIKAGGVEQLAALTRILQVPLHTVEDGHALRIAIDHAPQDACVFIDTPGINPFSDTDLAELRALLGGEALLRVLALPAGGDPAEVADIAVRCTEGLKVEALLSTRLDHTRRLGALLTAADSGGLSFAGVTASPSAADAPLALTPAQLAQMLLLPLNQSKLSTGQQPKINAFAPE